MKYNANTYYVYILKCSDNSFYVGVTNNIERRFAEHQQGVDINSYIYSRRPVELVFYGEFSNPDIAIEYEKKIKKWSRKKKQALIDGEFEKLPNLSKKKFNK